MLTIIRDVVEAFCVVYLVLVVHELGHFVVAHSLRMPISSFEVGTGPRLFQFLWQGMWFRFYLVPLSGFVKVCWLSRKRWKNVALFAAGPAANFAFALAIFVIAGPASGTDLSHRLLNTSLVLGILNLVPMRLFGTDSDGLQMKRQFKRKAALRS